MSLDQQCPLQVSSPLPLLATERSFGLDHRVGHLRPLSLLAYDLARLVLSSVRSFCMAQKQPGVVDAMIDACDGMCQC